MKLRDYQEKAVKDIYSHFRNGKKSVMVVSGTGTGKTAIASQLLKDCHSRGRRALFICHRRNLIEQTARTLESFGVDCGYIVAGKKADYSKTIQLAMVQTIQNRPLPEDIGLVIIDECHVTNYFNFITDIYDKYSGGIWALSKCFFTGLTATPWRSNKKEGFCQYYQAVVKTVPSREMIKRGYLTKERIFSPEISLDLANIDKDSNGEFTTGGLIRACNDEYNQDVVDKFTEICPDRKAIVFCVGVAQAESMTEKFRAKGYKTAMIVGSTKDDECEKIYNDFKTGEIQILTSVGVLTEGFDEPSANCVVLARPTRSLALAIQMIGRGARLFPGKDDFYILDFGGIIDWMTNIKVGDGKIDDIMSVFHAPLCPRWKPSNFSETKICTNCEKEIPVFAKICPHCGVTVAQKKEKTKPQELEFPGLVEYMSSEQRSQYKWVRSEIRKLYNKSGEPWLALYKFKEKFGILPPKEWMLGAIFEMKELDTSPQIFIDKCLRSQPGQSERQIRFWLTIEFGEPQKTYILPSGEKYVAREIEYNRFDWSTFLEIHSFSPESTIKTSYQEKVLTTNNPIALNYALDTALVNRAGKY